MPGLGYTGQAMAATAPVRPYHLSVVLSGGVSLGAYQAGAVAQLGYFVAKWNETAQQRRVCPIHVDVVSGASAGALTGAMLARFVALGCQDPEGYVREHHAAWCGDRLSFRRLLAAEHCRDGSFLSNSVVEEEAAKFIPDSGAVRLAHGQTRLIFTCTLTSLGAIPFATSLPEASLVPGEGGTTEIVGTTRREWITFRFVHRSALESRDIAQDTGKGSETKNASARFGDYLMIELGSDPAQGGEEMLWSRFRWSALASGALPYAWSPVRIPRSLRFYPKAFGGGEGAGVADRDLVDGGMLDNMPLGRAARVLQDYAKHVPTADEGLITERAYVLIEPSQPNRAETPPSSSAEGPSRLGRLRAADVSGDLFSAIREQSFYTDLRTSQSVNARLRSRERCSWRHLAEWCSRVSDEEAGQRLDEVLEEVGHLLQDFRGPEEALRNYQARGDVSEAGRAASLEGVRWALFAAQALYHDLLADLESKHGLSVLRVAASRPLASAFMGSFGGFVHPSFMHHDFCVALADAQAALTRLVSGTAEGAELSGCFFDASGLPEPEPGPKQVGAFEELPEDVRSQFVGQLRRRALPYLFLSLADPQVAASVFDGTWNPTLADVEKFGPIRSIVYGLGSVVGAVLVSGLVLTVWRPGSADSPWHYLGTFLLALGAVLFGLFVLGAWWVHKNLLEPLRRQAPARR